MIVPSNRLALMMTGFVRLRNGKMGFGLLRYSENPIACVIAADEVSSGGLPGQTLRELTGINTDVPIVADVAAARGIALNCARLSPAEIEVACGEVEAETGLVCVDVVHHGAQRLLAAILG